MHVCNENAVTFLLSPIHGLFVNQDLGQTELTALFRKTWGICKEIKRNLMLCKICILISKLGYKNLHCHLSLLYL